MPRTPRHACRAFVASLALLASGCEGPGPVIPLVPTSPPAPSATYTLSGTVYEETTAGTIPVDGAAVAVSSSSLRIVTDKQGSFTVAGVLPLLTSMSVTKYGFVTAAKSIVVSGDTRIDVQLSRMPSFTLSGMVFELTERGRTPVVGVSVYCDSCGSPDGHTFANTDAGGAYSFAWSLNGATPLYVTKAGYRVPGAPDGRVIVNVSGDTRFDIELVRQ
jgi:hypothetical protein